MPPISENVVYYWLGHIFRTKKRRIQKVETDRLPNGKIRRKIFARAARHQALMYQSTCNELQKSYRRQYNELVRKYGS